MMEYPWIDFSALLAGTAQQSSQVGAMTYHPNASPNPLAWAAIREARSGSANQHEPAPTTTTSIGPMDVMLGRGTGPNEHIGNRTFRDEVEARKTEYQCLQSRRDKFMVEQEVIEFVRKRGGRFVRKISSATTCSSSRGKNKKHGMRTAVSMPAVYEIVSDRKAIAYKVKQAFRYLKEKSHQPVGAGQGGSTSSSHPRSLTAEGAPDASASPRSGSSSSPPLVAPTPAASNTTRSHEDPTNSLQVVPAGGTESGTPSLANAPAGAAIATLPTPPATDQSILLLQRILASSALPQAGGRISAPPSVSQILSAATIPQPNLLLTPPVVATPSALTSGINPSVLLSLLAQGASAASPVVGEQGPVFLPASNPALPTNIGQSIADLLVQLQVRLQQKDAQEQRQQRDQQRQNGALIALLQQLLFNEIQKPSVGS